MALEYYREDMERCSRCSMCKFVPMEKISCHEFSTVCPSIAKYNFHSYSAGGRLNMALSLIDGRIDFTDKLVEMVYRCQMCGACDVSCKYHRDLEPLEVMYQLRIKCIENGQLIPAHMLMINSLRKEDNMMECVKAERGKWSEGLDIKNILNEKAEVYFHAGCRYSFDKELWPIVRSAVNILKKAGVDVGIAGGEEACCGGRAYEIGYSGEMIKFADHNSDMLRMAGAKTLVTACAECYYAFKVLYRKTDQNLNIEVLHITEYLNRLIAEGKLKFNKSIPMIVTYHDPCHLGRMGEDWIPWKGRKTKILGQLVISEPDKEFRRGTNGIYQPPRDILNSIPKLRFVEMPRTKEYAWCCGAGGGVREAFPDYSKWVALERIREAKTTGAEALVTACPWCKRNFLDAIRESGDRLEVLDILELVKQSL